MEGNAPYSYWKIALFVLFLIAVSLILLMIYGSQAGQSSQSYRY